MKSIIVCFLIASTWMSAASVFPAELRRTAVLAAGGAPKSLAISPAGDVVAVNNLEAGSVWLYDRRTRAVTRKVRFERTPCTVPGAGGRVSSFEEKPVECVFSRTGRFVFVSLHNAGGIVIYDRRESMAWSGPTRKVTVEDVPGGRRRALRLPFIRTGKTPKVIAISPDGKWFLVANWSSATVSVISAHSPGNVRNLHVRPYPRGIAFTKDSRYAVVADMGSDVLSLIDLRKSAVIGAFHVGASPRHLVTARDGRHIYVSLNGPGLVNKVELGTGRLAGSVRTGVNPRTIALSPDGRLLFVVNYGEDTVALVDAVSMRLLSKVPAGSHPCGVVVSPDGREVWVSNYFANTIGVYSVAMTPAGSSR